MNRTLKISPNVVLRPLYQECILPNLAYVGGLQSSSTAAVEINFAHFDVTFPTDAAKFRGVINKNTYRKIIQTELSWEDLLRDELTLVNEKVAETTQFARP